MSMSILHMDKYLHLEPQSLFHYSIGNSIYDMHVYVLRVYTLINFGTTTQCGLNIQTLIFCLTAT